MARSPLVSTPWCPSPAAWTRAQYRPISLTVRHGRFRPGRRNLSGTWHTPACLLVRTRSTGPRQLELLQPVEDLVEDHPDLQSGQVGPQAEVGAVRRRSRWGFGRPPDVEPERLVEHRLVPVGRRPPQRDLVPGRDGLAAAARCRGWRCAGCRGWRSSTAGSPPPPWASATGRRGARLELVGMLDERHHARGRWSCGWSRFRPPPAG